MVNKMLELHDIDVPEFLRVLDTCEGNVFLMTREGDKLICMIHYPPFNSKKEDSAFTQMFEEQHADVVVYGHIHQNAGSYPLQCERNGIKYYLTSCDLLGFRLVQIV